MRPRFVENLARCPVLDHDSQDLRDQWIRASAGEFPVGEGARSALAEKEVGLRVVCTALPEGPDVADASLQRGAALYQQGGVSVLAQEIGREEPCGTASDDGHPARQRLPARLKACQWVRVFDQGGPAIRPRTSRIRESHINAVDPLQTAFVPRVERAPRQPQLADRVRRDTEPFGRQAAQQLAVIIQFQSKIVDAQKAQGRLLSLKWRGIIASSSGNLAPVTYRGTGRSQSLGTPASRWLPGELRPPIPPRRRRAQGGTSRSAQFLRSKRLAQNPEQLGH